MERLIPANRSQLLLLPPSLQEWVPEDDLVHFVIEAVDGLTLPSLRVNSRGTGSAQYPPKMMLELRIYCYANGIFNSRHIERATYRDISVRYLTADTHPDHDTIAAFLRENLEAVSACFVEVLKLAGQMLLLKVGTVSVDGTKVKASASKDKNVRYDRAVQLEAKLTADVGDLLAKAESADNTDEADGTRLPEDVNPLSKLKRKMQEAREELERRNRERVEAERREYEAKLAERQGGDKGIQPQAPSDEQRQDEQCNLTDKGYGSRETMEALEARDVDAYIAVEAEGTMQARKYEFRPPKDEKAPRKGPMKPWKARMAEMLGTEAGRRLYRLRKQTVEPVFGIIKQAMGFRQFLLRGLRKVEGEWSLLCLAYNIRRLHTLSRAKA